MVRKSLKSMAIGFLLFGTTHLAQAGVINWASDWTIPQTGIAVGTLAQNGNTIDVTYTGHIRGLAPSSYWIESTPAPYTGNPVVDNAPTLGISLSAVSTAAPAYANVLIFSAPVIDPVFALYSVGQQSLPVPYEFDQSFALLSEGNGAWGDGSFEISGNTITGYEGHGVIQFYGPISAIAWNNPVAENHHGFAVGASEEAAAVPIPGAIILLGSGLAGVAGLRFRRDSSSAEVPG